jgi:acetone carboxylase gamma subunit
MSRRLSEGLALEGGRIRCRRCGHALASAGTPWKAAAVVHEQPMAGAAGAPYSAGAEVRLRRFCCPGCGALLDSETALAGDPALDDVVEPPALG